MVCGCGKSGTHIDMCTHLHTDTVYISENKYSYNLNKYRLSRNIILIKLMAISCVHARLKYLCQAKIYVTEILSS